MAGGFAGRLLRIDLTTGTGRIESLDELFLRRYLGGGLMGVYFLLRETPPGLDPYDPRAPLIIATSAMNGTAMSGANRYSVVAKSPLTLAFGESEAGGFWGPALKQAGFDAVLITGRAPRPTVLVIHAGGWELRDGAKYWGREAAEVDEALKTDLGEPRAVVLQTGIAGENRVRFAALVNNCKHFHGRCGLGAVMASKNLKAVVAVGKGRVSPAEPELARMAQRHFHSVYDRRSDTMHLYGTARGVKNLQRDGILPTYNFRTGVFDQFENITGQRMAETILTRRGTCYACAVACKREVAVPELGVVPKYGGPEYESIAALGSLNGVGDLKKIALANQLCAKYVLDSISTGAVIAFAIEAFERGLLTESDTGGLRLRFGDPDVVVRLIELIAHRQGIGALLAEGVARAAKQLGPAAERIALHVRGQELPMHEPRGKKSLALAYATSPTGADHMEAPHDPLFEGFYPGKHALAPLGLVEPVDMLDFSPRKVKAFAYAQKLWNFYNIVGMCCFVGVPIGSLDLHTLEQYLRGVTAWDISLWELCKAAERSSALFRIYNHREGRGTEYDGLPARMFEPIQSGPLQGERIDPVEFRARLRDYYALMGWDPERGVPTQATLNDLDIPWAAQWL